MSTDPSPRPGTAGSGTANIVLRLLAQRLEPSVALVASVRGGELIVEESSSGAWLGRRLRPPCAFAARHGARIAVGAERLSTGWTQLCGWRPRHITIEPVPAQSLQLVVASEGDPPDRHDLAEVAAVIGRLLGTADVTARARGASSRVAALIDSLPLPIAFVDSRTIEVFLNGPARGLLNITSDEASEAEVAAAFSRLVVNARDDYGAQLAARPDADMIFDIASGGRRFQVESRWIDEDRLTGRLWMFRDVTDEREAAQFKDELVSTVSHELRTPLTSIVGSLGLLRSGTLGAIPDKADWLIEVAHRNGNRLVRLINDLLDLDKIKAGGFDLDRQTVDIATLLREAVEQNEPYAHRYGVRLALDLPPEPIAAHVDATRLLQVVANLVSNAAKFSPEGGIVRITLCTHGPMLRIRVIDSGPGISPDFRKRLFKRFAQDGTGAQKTGTGLGLAICKGIVEQHGGTIALDAEAAVGAIFVVELPLAEPAIPGGAPV